MQGGNIQSATDFSVGFIPTVTLTYKRFLISGSYMVTPKCDFGTATDLTIQPLRFIDVQELALREQNTTASRQEGDLTVGYFPLDWLGVAIVWKGVFQDYESITRFTSSIDLQVFESKSDSTTRYNGPIFGILGSARINDGFALLGNAFGGYMVVSCSPDCPEFGHGSYAASNLVVRYAPKSLPQRSLTLGYRVQVINTDIDAQGFDTGNGIDLTHGPVFEVNYRF